MRNLPEITRPRRGSASSATAESYHRRALLAVTLAAGAAQAALVLVTDPAGGAEAETVGAELSRQAQIGDRRLRHASRRGLGDAHAERAGEVAAQRRILVAVVRRGAGVRAHLDARR